MKMKIRWPFVWRKKYDAAISDLADTQKALRESHFELDAYKRRWAEFLLTDTERAMSQFRRKTR